MNIVATDPRDPQVALLLAASDAYMHALYPADSNYLDSVQVLAAPNVHFVGAWLGGQLVACGALKLMQDSDGAYGEVKRVFVLPEHRSQGYSKAVMLALEAHARVLQLPRLRLELGIYQPEALSLYLMMGFAPRGPFGQYPPDPLSLFMENALTH